MNSLAHWIADLTNPLLTVCVIIAPLNSPRPWRFWARAVAGIGLAVLAAGTLLIRRDPRWLVPVLPAALILAWALVEAHYHQPVDVAGALLIAPPLALLGERLLTPRRPRGDA